jgi:peptidoglycan/LPS O-acetylase OafA/YrhL
MGRLDLVSVVAKETLASDDAAASPPSAGAPKVHFKGLNSLRFLAALFVILGHIPLNQESVGLPHPSDGKFFYRGAPAVSFFFTLSGFLITYLLLEERQRTHEIDVRRFYLRRVCRIWPLYFAVIAFGLFFYNSLLPAIGIPYPTEYSIWLAVLLYVFFLPNLMNSLYTVGGILNPTWSIGVEEQFYLVWAPVTKRWHELLPRICAAIIAVFFAIYCLANLDVFGAHEWKNFFLQLKFYFMAAGGLCAWWLHRRRDRFLSLPVFKHRPLQILLFALLLDLYLVGFVKWNWLLDEIVQLFLYSWIIVNVSANPRNVIPLENRVFDYLGVISYGIYMYHMVAIYATSALFMKTAFWRSSLALYCSAYYTSVLGLTILLAHLSYRFFESPFLRLKERRFSPPAVPGGRAARWSRPARLPL